MVTMLPNFEKPPIGCSYLYSCGHTDKLRKYFSTYGSVQDAVVMKDPMTKKSRGFGFITFTDADTVDAVLESEPHTIDSRKVCTHH